eukprot:1146487-Pelagomonas_calceolata.AAC.5
MKGPNSFQLILSKDKFADTICSKSVGKEAGFQAGTVWNGCAQILTWDHDRYHAIKAGKFSSVDGNKTQPLELRSVVAS